MIRVQRRNTWRYLMILHMAAPAYQCSVMRQIMSVITLIMATNKSTASISRETSSS